MGEWATRWAAERFAERYRVSHSDAMIAVELEALGTDYGATGYTDRAEADAIGELLGLTADSLLVDLGSGCGWPGLYLAGRSQCRVVTIDPVASGVRRSAARGRADGLAGRHLAVVGDGSTLPLAGGVADAIVHVDVLC